MQTEQIVLAAEDRTAAPVQSANKNVSSFEATAKKAGEAAAKAGQQAAGAVVVVTETSQKQIDKILKSVENRVAALKSPIERLQQQRDSALTRVGGDSGAQQKIIQGFSTLIAAQQDKLNVLGKSVDETGSKIKQFGTFVKQGIENPTVAAEGAVESFAEKFGVLGIAAGVTVGVLVAAGAATFELVKSQGEAAESTLNLATRMGINSDQAQIMDRSARLVGVSTDSLVAIQRKLSQTLVEGGAPQQAAIKRLEDMGIKVVTSSGQFRDSGDILQQFSENLDKFPDHATKVKALTDVFGRGAIEILPYIEKLKDVDAESRRVADTLSHEQLEALDDANRKIKEVGIQWDVLKSKLAINAVAVVEFVVQAPTGFKDWTDFRKFLLGQDRRTPEQIKQDQFPLVEATETPQFKASQEAAAKRAQGVVDSFRNRQDLAGLQNNLALIESERNNVGATIQSGLDESTANTQIAKYDKLTAAVERLKQQIKEINELPEKQKQAHELLLKTEAAEATGLSQLYIQRQNSLEQLGVTAQAIRDINAAYRIKLDLETRAEALALKQAKTQNDLSRLDIDKTAALRSLEPQTPEDVDHQGTLGARRAEVNADFEAQALALHERSIIDQTNFELTRLKVARDAKLVDEKTYAEDVIQISRLATEKTTAARLATEKTVNEQIAAARVAAVVQTVTTINSLERLALAQRDQLAEQAAGISKDTQLRTLEAVTATTLQEQIALNAAKAGLEVDYQQKVLAIKEVGIEREKELEVQKQIDLYNAGLISWDQYYRVYQAIAGDAQNKVDQIRQSASAATDAAIQEGAIRSANMIRDHYQQIFDGYKQSVRGILDDVLDKGDNLFKAIGSRIKTAFENGFKDAVASKAAAILTEATTGQPVSLVHEAAGNGPLGKLFGGLGLGASKPVFQKLEAPGHLGDLNLIGGAVPVIMVGGGGPGTSQGVSFARSGGVRGPNLLGGLGGLLIPGIGASSFPGSSATPSGVASSSIDFGDGPQNAPPAFYQGSDAVGSIYNGGLPGLATPPFLPDGGGVAGGVGAQGGIGAALGAGGGGGAVASGGAGGAGGGILGSAGTALSLGKLLAGGKKQLAGLGNLASGFSTAHGGVNGAAGGALLAGGGLLAVDGLRRGGVGGLAEDTIGGAAIGFKFGGPVGAAIGAGVGLLAGVARLFIKTKTEKIVDKVKQIYNIKIDKRFAADPIQKIIDSKYGGNVDVGIRSPEVQDTLQLYAQSTGQPWQLTNKPYTVGLNIQNGQVVQTAASVDGSAVAYGGGSAGISGPVDKLITGSTPGGPGGPGQLVVQNLSLSLNGQSAARALTGQIASSPEAVGQGSLAAAALGTSRRQLAVAQTTPGLLLS